jgi:hypothetical protein
VIRLRRALDQEERAAAGGAIKLGEEPLVRDRPFTVNVRLRLG